MILPKIESEKVWEKKGFCSILHHTSRFALDPTHDSEKIQVLCKAHERIAHAGLIENEEMMPIDVPAQETNLPIGVHVNWHVQTTPDTSARKYAIDKKVMAYYKPILTSAVSIKNVTGPSLTSSTSM